MTDRILRKLNISGFVGGSGETLQISSSPSLFFFFLLSETRVSLYETKAKVQHPAVLKECRLLDLPVLVHLTKFWVGCEVNWDS